MVNGIGREKKLGKQNRQQTVVTNCSSNKTSPYSHSYDKFNDKSDVPSK